MFWNRWKSKSSSPQIRRVESAGLTHTGLRRSRNEDAIYLSDEQGLYLVADGMGGHALGDVASQIAVASLAEAFSHPPRETAPGAQLVEAIREANRRIHLYAQEQLFPAPEPTTLVSGMGTTIVALLLQEDHALIAHVGDSRAYRYREGTLELLTRDHSLVEEMAASGLQPPGSVRPGFRNILTRALGIEPDVAVDLREEPLQRGDLFLLCSDGLTNMVPAEGIRDLLATHPTLSEACQALVDKANHNGGRDNISCVLVRV